MGVPAAGPQPGGARRLIEELDGGGGEEYLTATVQEVLRHRPVFLFAIPRAVKQPIEIGGWTYRPPTQLLGCIYLVHHDPELYPEPHEFRPERFLESSPSTYTWLPWGGGRKRCPGLHLAMLEMKTVLRTVLATMTVLPAARKTRAPTLAQRDRHPARGIARGAPAPRLRPPKPDAALPRTAGIARVLGIDGDASLGRGRTVVSIAPMTTMSENGVSIELSKAQINRVVREAAQDGGLRGLAGMGRPARRRRIQRATRRRALLAVAAAGPDGARGLPGRWERSRGDGCGKTAWHGRQHGAPLCRRRSSRSVCWSAIRFRAGIGCAGKG